MCLVADMVATLCPNQIADNALEARTHDGFATIEPKGAGFTWVPVPIGLGLELKAPPQELTYTTKLAAYEGRKRAIDDLLRQVREEVRQNHG